jgi:RHS repeat-associated protein
LGLFSEGFADDTYGQQIEKQVYNGPVSSANLIETVITCYNAGSTLSNCEAGYSFYPSEKDEYTTYPGVTGYSAVKTAYAAGGLITDVQSFDFNETTPTNEKQIVYGTGSPSSQTCTAISIYIVAKPCKITLLDSQHNNAILSQTWNSYDGNGNLLQTWNLVSGSGASGTYLSKSYTYVAAQNGTPAETNGVVQTMTDVNGQVMNYTATSCNNMFVTSQYPTNFSNLQTSQTWDCNGGVVTSSTDANGQTTHTNFYVGTTTDPFYRPLQDEDELNNITSFTYGYTSASLGTTDSQFMFNGNASVIETLSTTDSIGRPAVSQLRQGPSSANWETKSRTFDSDGRTYETSLTCVGAASTACSASTESQTYDGLNRPLVHTGTGGDIVTKTYPANDVLTKLTPAPSNENAKQVQKEYDGLGRLKSACIISSAAGSASCGQTTAATGFLTTYTYDAGGRLLQTVENAQVSSPNQTRKYTYDLLGRVTSETNPEWASTTGSLTATYTYDSVSGSQACATPTGMTLGSKGDLIEKVDPNGNTTCYFYDSLHRNIAITYAGPNSNNVNKFFVYDAATVDGTAMTYTEGRLAEAYTCSGATLPCSSKITDEGFSYDQRGLMSAYYQKSPNSGGYYAMSATRWEDKQLKTVSGVGLPTLTYGTLDGEGRVQTVGASSGANPVSGVTYSTGPGPDDSIGSVLTATLGAGDTQNFTYYQTTGRMKSYSASVGSTPTVISGSLSWNANGTLQQLTISDGYNSADTQVCSYLYDDFVRVAGITGSNPIAGVNCVNGSTKVWNETYTYGSDSFGNLSKTTTGPGTSWACTACYNTATNQYNSTLSGNIRYDSDGNLLNDTFHSYTWLPDGHVATIDTNTITYDANGNKVEENVGGVIHEYVSAFGISAQMTGQTENSTLASLPGGVQALYSGGTLQRFRFPDWQGTIRAESNPSTRMFTESLAFAPFGERYALKGAPYNVDSFTGKPDQIVSDEYDFPAREEHGGQGRWISPDPMRGTGNKYVYADNNPLSKVDVYGLIASQQQMDPGMQAWFDYESNRPDPLLESRASSNWQTGAGAFAASENAYLSQVSFAFGADISVEDPPRLLRAQAKRAQTQGQPAQEAQNRRDPTNSVEVIIEYDKILGITFADHATLYVNWNTTWEIYDPDGQYSISKKETESDIVTEEDGASKSEWEQASRNKSDHIERYSTYVLSDDAKRIMANIEKSTDAHQNLENMPCARSVSTVLSGVGMFKDLKVTSRPSVLADQLLQLGILPDR